MIKQVWSLYYDGFCQMPRWAKVLWVIILAKVLVMFIVFKMIFMPNYLNRVYDSDEERANHVLKELIRE